jgi:hypothetical protein
MEPSGCNGWQSVANGTDLKTAQKSENLVRTAMKKGLLQ